jgi:hypothetical protein
VRTFFEGQVQQTPVAAGSDPVWCKEGQAPDPKASFEFDVTDLTGNIQLSIMDDKKVLKDHVLGQVIVPLTSLYTPNFGIVPLRMEWHELFPAPSENLRDTTTNRLFAAENTVKGAGMPRPKRSLGFLQIEIGLTLNPTLYAPPYVPPLAAAFLLSTPYYAPAEPTLEPAILKREIVRIKRAIGAPYWLQLIMEIISWQYPPLSIGGLAAWIYLCLYGALWLYIPVGVALLLYGGHRSYKAREARRAELISWDEDAAPDPNMPTAVIDKLKKVKDIIVKIQQLLGKVASNMERSSNTLNWTDKRITMMVSIFLIIGALPLSLLFYFVPLHLVILMVGLFVFAKPVLSKKKKRDAPKEPSKIAVAVKNLLGRVPDGLEDTNRIFAERATVTGNLPVDSLLGLERPE